MGFLTLAYLTSSCHLRLTTANILALNKNKVQSARDGMSDTICRHRSFKEWQDLQQSSVGFLTQGNEQSRHRAFWACVFRPLSSCFPSAQEKKKSELSMNSAFTECHDQLRHFQKRGFRCFRKDARKSSRPFKACVWIEGLLLDAANKSFVFIFSNCTSKFPHRALISKSYDRHFVMDAATKSLAWGVFADQPYWRNPEKSRSDVNHSLVPCC